MATACPHCDNDRLQQRAAILRAIRDFFVTHAFLEVETPVRIPAPAPEVHIDAEPSGDWFLQTSPELCMKRLLAAGFPKIYQICKCFRARERGGRHLPEMTLLEWYAAGSDYRRMMVQTQALLIHVAEQVGRYPRLSYQGRSINLSPPWHRVTVAQAFEIYTETTVDQALDQGRFDELMGLRIEPRLGWDRPLFLFDYPARCGALARLKSGDPQVVERFELYIGGLELCNAFSELTDTVEQHRRFAHDAGMRQQMGKTVYPWPETFLDVLDHMPEAAGNALGIDRLVMLLTDAKCIDAVVAFTPEGL
ncbi:MAG: EF-P lysine aminoacylase GenX [Desulfatitalea sp.]|nr:EF-P lysine aminoacylase GenX [Desulfatitalea sp.]NNK00672.1 EF-P lysine aminoacylase GenX [Desulfatitalea sp.]